MNIQEYLIDPRGKDWRKLRAYWIPLMPDDASLWFVNRLGEIIFASPRGTIHRLVVGSGTVDELAPDRQAMARLLDVPENADAWLRITLIDGCARAGMRLGPDECFGFKVPPALQGNYEVANLEPKNIYTHYSWLSHIWRQDEIYWTGD